MKVRKIRRGRYQVTIGDMELIINKYDDNKSWGIYELINGEWEGNWVDTIYRPPTTKRDTLKIIDKVFGEA